MPASVYDVAILSDFRHPGGVSASIAAEVHAQAEAALTTVLVHVPSPHRPRALPFDPRISDLLRDGAATLARDGEPVSARLLLIRQPRIFTEDPAVPPAIEAERTVLVMHQPPGDAYDLTAVRERVHRYFGAAVRWAPVGERVRRAVPDCPLTADDWHEIIDVARWWRERDGFAAETPVLGRPDGAGPVDSPAGWPADWEVRDSGAEPPEDFLRTIDFFVCLPGSEGGGPSGRALLEAMAAGVPAIVGEHLRPVLSDAALYTTPAGVPDLVRELYADPDRYRAVASRAREFVERRYGHQSHLTRLAALGIRPRISPAVVPADSVPACSLPAVPVAPAVPTARRTAPPAPPRRVLMVSDNGTGMGHLTRLMAIARRLPTGVEAVIATQSYAAAVAHREGFLTEYIPSRAALDAAQPRWTALLRARLAHLVELHEPAVVAVDCLPHPGIVEAVRAHPGLTWVWVRRAMWQRGTGSDWIAEGRVFDHVLEPGEFAAAADLGATVSDRHAAHQVAPVTFLDAGELLQPAEARTGLGLDDRPAALVQLGAGDGVAAPAARICRHLADHGYQVVLAESPIATRPLAPAGGAKVVRLFPVSRHLRAFDLAVSAAGYNSFHEQLAAAIPTVFLPNAATRLDDQVCRARFAAATGAALTVEAPGSDELEQALDRIVRPEVRAGLARRCAELAFSNGGAEAAAWLSGLPARQVRVGG